LGRRGEKSNVEYRTSKSETMSKLEFPNVQNTGGRRPDSFDGSTMLTVGKPAQATAGKLRTKAGPRGAGEENTAEMMLTIAVGVLALDSRLGLLYHSAFRWFPGAQQSEPTAV
jgi:hypothetical protein